MQEIRFLTMNSVFQPILFYVYLYINKYIPLYVFIYTNNVIWTMYSNK